MVLVCVCVFDCCVFVCWCCPCVCWCWVGACAWAACCWCGCCCCCCCCCALLEYKLSKKSEPDEGWSKNGTVSTRSVVCAFVFVCFVCVSLLLLSETSKLGERKSTVPCGASFFGVGSGWTGEDGGISGSAGWRGIGFDCWGSDWGIGWGGSGFACSGCLVSIICGW